MLSETVAQLKTSFIRDILAATQQPGVISFAGGLPDTNLFPLDALKAAYLDMHQRWGGRAYQYGETQGVEPLRRWILDHLVERPDTPIEQLVITSGTQQGLDLLARSVLNPGDTVLVEAPSYMGAFQAFTGAGAKIVAVKCDEGGPIIEDLKLKLSDPSVRLFYTMPNFQNPTGLCYDLERRQQITEQLKRRPKVWLIEDDPYYALRYSGDMLPSLQSGLPEQSIRLGSFSKIVAPSLRLGWLLGPKELASSIVKFKQVTDLHTSCINQFQLLSFLEQGVMQSHIETLIEAYRLRRDTMVSSLTEHLPPGAHFERPDGGMFIWLSLPDHMDSSVLFLEAIKENLAFVPGRAFFTEEQCSHQLRLNYTHSSLAEIEQGISLLGKLIKNNI